MNKRVIIIGAGFAGLDATHTLSRQPNVDVLLIDRNNYHTFTPLLYQVATCGLDPSAIAYPIRSIFRDKANVQFLMGNVTAIDYHNKALELQTAEGTRREAYDYLIVATGSVTNHFGKASLEAHSFGLKDLDDAIALRQHILRLFEKASWTQDPTAREALMTFAIAGGGPTGIETAGAVYELYNDVLLKEYGAQKPPLKARVLLLEASHTLLAPYPKPLQEAAITQLSSLGVEVVLNAAVEDVTPEAVFLADGRVIPTHTLIWSAGVKASPLLSHLDVTPKRWGRVQPLATLQLPEREGVYLAGDLVYLEDDKGEPYPMVIQVAKQQGKLAAQNILRELNGQDLLPFKYNDLGIMATIGRSRAVAWLFNRVQLQGYIAWLAWLFLHLVTLLGFRNRASVFMSWVWNYFTYDRSVRIILDDRQTKKVYEERQPV
jgi:NADH dehydrogenase